MIAVIFLFELLLRKWEEINKVSYYGPVVISSLIQTITIFADPYVRKMAPYSL